jgi:hypothetical protein
MFHISLIACCCSNYLGLPAEVIPKSLQKPAQPSVKKLGGGSDRPPRPERGDREGGYRARGAPSADVKDTGSFNPSFVCFNRPTLLLASIGLIGCVPV